MSAQLRDYYLNTLGVVQYVPADFEMVAEAIEAPAPVAVDSTPAAPAQPVDDVAKPRARPPIDVAALTAQKPAAKPSLQVAADNSVAAPGLEQEQEPQVKLRVCYWQVADIIVFGALNYGQNPPQDQHLLLANILQAIGRLPGSLAEPKLMDWPQLANGGSDERGARSMYSTFFTTHMKKCGAQWALVMGSRAGEFLLAGKGVDERGQLTLDSGSKVIATAGLDEMLADPDRKRATWQRIKFLAQSTTAGE